MNLRALKAKFPEYATMSEAAFFNYMHKEYYSDMSRTQMHRAMLKLTEIVKKEEVKEEPKAGIGSKDKVALVKLGYTGKDIKTMPADKAVRVIEDKIEKPQEVIKAEKQEKILENIRAVSAKTLEAVAVLADSVPKETAMQPDMSMHVKMDALMKKMAPPKSAKKWEFEIIRDGRGNMDKVIATEVM